MKLNSALALMLICCLALNCRQPQSIADKKSTKPLPKQLIDSSKSFQIGSVWITPKKFFDYNSVLKSIGDTLDLVGCGEYIYSPFGPVNKKQNIAESLLKNFALTTVTDTSELHYVYQVLTYKSSKIKFFFYNDPEASKASFITEGDIRDADVPFAVDIRIGMKEADFVKVFFDDFPETDVKGFKVITFRSCVESIVHLYEFENGVLKSVRFITV